MSDEPSDIMITRKRKKWKFAHFEAWSNCFSAAEVTPELWPRYFHNRRPLVVELGAGTADLSVGLAARHPHKNYVAVDVKSDRLYAGARRAQLEDVDNIAFVRSHGNDLVKQFGEHRVGQLWITFPDPFPRDKQAKHRLMHPTFLKLYQSLLAPNGELHFKTDNRELFLWSLEQLVAESWRLRELSFDLHESSLSDEYKITTRYERRFLAEKLPINYLTATLPRK